MVFSLMLIIAVFIGILLITINIVKDNSKYQKKQIIHRYIPRTFDEEQEDPAHVSDIFATLYSLRTPWIYKVFNVSDINIHKEASLRDFIANRH